MLRGVGLLLKYLILGSNRGEILLYTHTVLGGRIALNQQAEGIFVADEANFNYFDCFCILELFILNL